MGFFTSTITPQRTPLSISGSGTIPFCGRCGLAQSCLSPKIKPGGSGKRKILLIGEIPGQQENIRGIPFVGPAGQCLRNYAYMEGLDIDDCLVTNSVICFSEKVEERQISYCRPTVMNTIKEFKPNVIILLGGSAVKSVIGTEWPRDIGGITRWAGWQIPSRRFNAFLCPTFHPSYVLRQKEDPALVLYFREHLRRAIALENSKPCWIDHEALVKTGELIPDPQAGRKRMLELSKKSGMLAFDLETNCLKPETVGAEIYSAAFYLDGGKDAFACRITPDTYDALRRVVTAPKLLKIGANLRFEERWCIQRLGCKVAGWHGDTNLMAHNLNNRTGITSVKFQTYIRFGVGDYSSEIEPFLKGTGKDDKHGLNRIKEFPILKTLSYNFLDAVFESMIWDQQTREFGLEQQA